MAWYLVYTCCPVYVCVCMYVCVYVCVWVLPCGYDYMACGLHIVNMKGCWEDLLQFW